MMHFTKLSVNANRGEKNGRCLLDLQINMSLQKNLNNKSQFGIGHPYSDELMVPFITPQFTLKGRRWKAAAVMRLSVKKI
jgi:hypothetical protein